ncbi:growth-regulating factor 7-like [Curcuma longa]|uniref:growth-regulating factor 7-like n=1 Tax=Curcuma longa TaxID=136217 RepID=UPI003D9E9E12
MELGGALSMVDGSAVGGGSGSSEGGSRLSCSLTTSSSTTEVRCKPKGQGLLGRAFQRAAELDDCDWRSLKMARTEVMVPPFDSVFSDGEQMLSFSATSKEDSFALACDGDLPSYHPSIPSSSPKPYLWNAGLYSGCHDVNANGVLARLKGPFTPSQWLELEHQALIYKYIVAKVPIPPNLLIPIQRSLVSSGFSRFSAGSFGSNPFGWGSFYLGCSGNVDPEPGRCRRTDGKKWRCSRDAVADQKYCERHINRGRRRSRKHVEGQSDHAAKAMPVASPSQLASPVSGSRPPSNLRASQSQTKTAMSAAGDPRPAPFDMMSLSKENTNDQVQDAASRSMLTSTNSEAMTSKPVSRKQSASSHFNLESSSLSDINLVPTLKPDAIESQSNPLRHFIDDWSKTQSDCSTITWPEIEDVRSERTQLSMSIPMASSEFSSSTAPNHESDTESRLCRMSEANQRQASWIPIFWEASVGGPLGEVLSALKNTNNKTCSSSASLNLLPDGWDSTPRVESSPTGVLQKTSLGSLTSSTVSSPTTENKTNESTGSLCNDLLDPTIVAHPTIL